VIDALGAWKFFTNLLRGQIASFTVYAQRGAWKSTMLSPSSFTWPKS
jgi:hypothetical protein